MITVAVINRRRRDLLHECLTSIETAIAQTPSEVKLIVIDNASDDGSPELVTERHPAAQLVSLDSNEGFSPAVVRATALASGEWLTVVNNDARIEPTALALMLAAGEARPDVGIITAQVRFSAAPDVVNSAGLEIDRLAIGYDRLAGRPVAEASGDRPVEVFGASACVAMYRMSMLNAIGGFDPRFFAFMEDADVSWRARMAGWRCLYEPRAVAYHHGSATAGEGSARKYELVGRNRVRLIAKNASRSQLLRWGWAMVLYDLAYVMFVLAIDRTLAPARGRLRGLAEWRAWRQSGALGRREIPMVGGLGWVMALRMRTGYRRGARSGSR